MPLAMAPHAREARWRRLGQAMVKWRLRPSQRRGLGVHGVPGPAPLAWPAAPLGHDLALPLPLAALACGALACGLAWHRCFFYVYESGQAIAPKLELY